MADNNQQVIKQLNDQFRRADDSANVPGQFVVTSGLLEHAQEHARSSLDLIEIVGAYEDFTPDNDPYGEHDFGVFEFEGEQCFWKIDYYAEATLTVGSDNAADVKACYRVLTVMLASEY